MTQGEQKVNEVETMRQLSITWSIIKELDLPKAVKDKVKIALNMRALEVRQLDLFKEG